RRDKYDRRQINMALSQRYAIKARHVHIEKQHIGSKRAGLRERALAILGLADDRDLRQPAEHAHQASARGLLIIDDQRAQAHGGTGVFICFPLSIGSRSFATQPPAGPASNTKSPRSP